MSTAINAINAIRRKVWDIQYSSMLSFLARRISKHKTRL
jgi:hypothetical protein